MELHAAQLPPQVLELKTHAISDSSRAYSRFIDRLHRRCGMQKAGMHKVAVQAALRLNLQCTFASWVQLSPTQKDALYVQALQILRTLSEYLKDCVVDLEQLAAEYRDAGNAAAAEEMLQQLTSVLHPQYSSEDELEEVKCEQEDSAAAQQVLLGGSSSNSGGGGSSETWCC